jgi:hypothetical protein
LQEIGQLDLGHAQHMRFEGAANGCETKFFKLKNTACVFLFVCL